MPTSRVAAVHAKGVFSCAYAFTQAPETLQTVEDWSKTGWRQALTGSTQFSERPKQTQNCSRQVLESSSKVSYAGFNRLHTLLREAKTDSKLFQTGPRELQQGFTFACPCIDASERFQTGLRELQKGFIFS